MRILIVKLSSLGDLFHALPAVHNLKAGLGATVDWVVQSEYRDLASCFTDVDQVIAVQRRAFFRTLRPFLRELRSRRYDLVVDLHGFFKSGVITFLSRGARKIGPSFHREGSRIFYGEVAGTRDRARHAVDQCMDVVRHLGVPLLAAEFPVAFPPQSVTSSRPRVGLVPVSRWTTKNWPPERYAEAAARLRREQGASVHLFGGRGDTESCAGIQRALGGEAENHCGRTTLVEMGGKLAAMDLVIANDSGPAHMAAAVGTPTLVIFGATDARRTGPYGAPHRVAEADLSCRPCYARACGRPRILCLDGVSTDQVVEMAGRMLALKLKDPVPAERAS